MASYMIVRVFHKNIYTAIQDLQNLVRAEMENGWTPLGGLQVAGPVTTRVPHDDKTYNGGFHHEELWIVMQPVFLTDEGEAKIDKELAERLRADRLENISKWPRYREVSERRAAGVSQRELATEYKVSTSTINTWIHKWDAVEIWFKSDPVLLDKWNEYLETNGTEKV